MYQVPSVTIIDPLTGRPNPRFWVLKLLKDELSPGVTVIPNTTWGFTVMRKPSPPPPSPKGTFCGSVTDPAFLMEIGCDELNAVISEVVFADYGTPSGGCMAPRITKNCSSAVLDEVVRRNCTGHHSCTINTYWPGVFPHIDPCLNIVKTLLVVARCSEGGGRAEAQNHAEKIHAVYAQGYEETGGGGQKLLLVNTQAQDQRVKVEGYGKTMAGCLARVVDQESGKSWYRNETVDMDGVLALAPFAVAVVRVVNK